MPSLFSWHSSTMSMWIGGDSVGLCRCKESPFAVLLRGSIRSWCHIHHWGLTQILSVPAHCTKLWCLRAEAGGILLEIRCSCYCPSAGQLSWGRLTWVLPIALKQSLVAIDLWKSWLWEASSHTRLKKGKQSRHAPAAAKRGRRN